MSNVKTIKGYMCATDWDIELPLAPDVEFPEIYKSQKALKRARKCWQECGIVQVEVSFKRLAVKGKWGRK